MDKKLISKVAGKNIWILIFCITTTINFMREVSLALYSPKGLEPINVNNVGYTLFQMKIDITQGSYNHLYVIYNYPLIPLFIGIIYNIYLFVKSYRNKIN